MANLEEVEPPRENSDKSVRRSDKRLLYQVREFVVDLQSKIF